MPTTLTVRTFEQSQQVQTVRNPTSVDVPDTSRNLRSSLNNVGKIIEQEQNRTNSIRTKKGDNEFQRLINERLHNANDGYVSVRRGEDAFNSQQEVMESLEKDRQRIIDSLENEDQKEIFTQMSDARMVGVNRTVLKHASTQKREFEVNTSKARIENSVENAVNDYSDGNLVLNQQVAHEEIRTINAGESDETINNLLDNYDNTLYTSVINRALNNDDIDTAKEMFIAYESGLSPKNRETLKDMIEEKDFDARVQAGADEIISLDLSDKEKLDKARNMTDDADLEKALVSEVKVRINEQKLFEKQEQNELYEDYGFQISEGETSYNNIPVQDRAKLTITQRQNLRKLEKALVEKDGFVTDDKLYVGLMLLPPDELAKVNPIEHREKLDDADFNRLITAVRSARNKSSKEDSIKLSNIQSNLASAKSLLEINKIEMDSEEGKKFLREAQNQIDDLSAKQPGQKVTGSQRDEIYDNLMFDVVTERNKGFFGFIENLTGLEFADNDVSQKVFEAGVPEADRAAIVEAYRAAGREPSEAEITSLYVRRLQNANQ